MLKYASASIALLALSNPALINSAWAATCASPNEAAALKTAVLQQELMVAALQCHESSAYNRFVTGYQPELQSSDASLKAFFVRRGGEHGEAGYDAFKTKAANLSALEEARDARAFCADAHTLFQAALAYHGTLASFVNSRPGAADVANICIESRPGPVLAQAGIRPPVAAPIVVASAPAALVHAAPAIKVAATAPVQEAVVGVPAHSLPAIPYEQEGMAPPPPPAPRVASQAAQDYAERDRELEDREVARNEEENDAAPVTADDDVPPAPPPRYYRVRTRRYADPYAYTSRAYDPYYYRDLPAPPPPPYWYRRGYSW